MTIHPSRIRCKMLTTNLEPVLFRTDCTDFLPAVLLFTGNHLLNRLIGCLSTQSTCQDRMDHTSVLLLHPTACADGVTADLTFTRRSIVINHGSAAYMTVFRCMKTAKRERIIKTIGTQWDTAFDTYSACCIIISDFSTAFPAFFRGVVLAKLRIPILA